MKHFYIMGNVGTRKFKEEQEFTDAFLEWVESVDGIFGGGLGNEGEENELFSLEPEHQQMVREILHTDWGTERKKGDEYQVLAAMIETAYKTWKANK